MVFELYRADARRPELVRRRLEELHASSVELADLEARLGEQPEGKVCPSCGLYCGDAQCCLACGHDLAHAPKQTTRMSPPMVALALVLLTAAWFFGGIRPGEDSERVSPAKQTVQAPERSSAAGFRNTVAHARRKGAMPIYRRPGGRPFRHLGNPNADGAPLAFLVKRQRPGWAQVYLPARPNGSTGWVPLSRVSLSGHDYRVVVDLGKRRLSAFRGRRRLARVPVGVGEAVTPTPTGLYFITELLKQPDRSGTYGPWAFGLSAYSNVLNEFAGADGILGIHGTNEPWAIGTDVSHGCIRVDNGTISRLARALPVGTPVRIRRT
jgi:lipoprotein-anchoring transpeptidase ErfK/SrfK